MGPQLFLRCSNCNNCILKDFNHRYLVDLNTFNNKTNYNINVDKNDIMLGDQM